LSVLVHAEVEGVEPSYRGKVRDIFDLGDRLLLVATDRISAFDVVLPDPIPERGAILTSITRFWFDTLGVRNHLISSRAEDLPEPFDRAAQGWGDRFMLVRKLEIVPVECIVRGFIAGSGWREYGASGTVCGIGLPTGLEECAELEHPLFTPSTKASEGHDENISKERAAEIAGQDLIDELERISVGLYERARTFARERGVILADTKFEFGLAAGDPVPILADEVLTPDSSRYWPADRYAPGQSQPSFDKEYVREYLRSQGYTGEGPPPSLPEEVIQGTRDRYAEIYRRLTGEEWKGGSS
jgi:phosphoribosylaminoimidazole-succinocarboxamide synthase